MGANPGLEKIKEAFIKLFYKGYTDISVEEFSGMRDGNNKREHTLVDVRDKRPGGIIPGSVNIPGHELETRIGELDLEKPIILYCNSGNQSGQAAKKLAALGAKNVINLAGGVKAWITAGKDHLPGE